MQRRSFLRSVALQPESPSPERVSPPPSGLEKYNGPWTDRQAAHLLRRTMFGPNLSQIKNISTLGLDQSIALLTAPLPLPEPPLNYDFTDDPNVPIGSTWVDAPNYNPNNYRRKSLGAWTLGRMASGEMNIREKMTLFWHNHFVTADINDPRFNYKYITLFRSNPLGNFKQLTKDITIDPAMLRYLNGNANTKTAPNENYARELLELFTIGKGPIVGPGDYTNYTEDDVIALAKVLTGWRDMGYNNINNNVIGSFFTATRHDTSTKTLSHRFDNVTIPNAGENEYKNLIDIIFAKKEVARFFCRNIYQWFMYYKIDENIESNVIEPMAQILYDNGYNTLPAITAFLQSAHFNDEALSGCMIKNPLDFMASIISQYNVPQSTDFVQKYKTWNNFFAYSTILQMAPFSHPSVAGWQAYYQEPSFYQIWLNSVTLPLRKQLTDTMATLGTVASNIRLDIDAIGFINTLTDPFDINQILADINLILLPKPFSEKQITVLKEIILPGLPDYEWTLEYTQLKDNPNDADLRKAIDTKIRNLLVYIMRMPEYQLS